MICTLILFLILTCPILTFSQNSTLGNNLKIPASGEIFWTKTSNPSSGNDVVNALVADSSGIFLLGWDYSPGGLNSQQRIEKRNPEDGSLIWTKTNDVSKYFDMVISATISRQSFILSEQSLMDSILPGILISVLQLAEMSFGIKK